MCMHACAKALGGQRSTSDHSSSCKTQIKTTKITSCNQALASGYLWPDFPGHSQSSGKTEEAPGVHFCCVLVHSSQPMVSAQVLGSRCMDIEMWFIHIMSVNWQWRMKLGVPGRWLELEIIILRGNKPDSKKSSVKCFIGTQKKQPTNPTNQQQQQQKSQNQKRTWR